MELLKKRFVYRKTANWVLGWVSGKLWLCNDRLRSEFDIPDKTKTIWLSLHNRDARDRLEVNFGPIGEGEKEYIVVDQIKTWISPGGMDKLFGHFGSKTVYLQCEVEV